MNSVRNIKGIVSDLTERKDMTPLADGYVCYSDFDLSGVNQNVLVVGSTGGGKTTSLVEPMLLHTHDRSMIVPVSKTALVDTYAPIFESKGYKVEVINLSDVKLSNVGYDPMDYVKNTTDVTSLATQLLGIDDLRHSNDPFWDNNAICVVASVIELVRLNAEAAGTKPKFIDVLNLLKRFKYHYQDGSNDFMVVDISELFDEAEKYKAFNAAGDKVEPVKVLPEKTAMSVYATFKAAIERMLCDDIETIVTKKDMIHFDEIDDTKTILFVVTSSFNDVLGDFANIMYSQMFKTLFEKAEKSPSKHLNNPIHVICDDFACGTKIAGFERYISVFRAAGISVTILLQSESQLSSLYGPHAATTIINNCATYVFVGSMDDATVRSVSNKMNLPYDKVMQLPLEHFMVMRMGAAPFTGLRYQTYEDPLYISMIKSGKKNAAKKRKAG